MTRILACLRLQHDDLSDMLRLGHVAEGVPCAKAVRELAGKIGVDMPITNAVAEVLFDGAKPLDTLAKLLARDPRGEIA